MSQTNWQAASSLWYHHCGFSQNNVWATFFWAKLWLWLISASLSKEEMTRWLWKATCVSCRWLCCDVCRPDIKPITAVAKLVHFKVYYSVSVNLKRGCLLLPDRGISWCWSHSLYLLLKFPELLLHGFNLQLVIQNLITFIFSTK